MNLLARLGLRTREQRAWAMYDWANSAMVTVIVAAVFPVFYASVPAGSLPPETATFRYSMATTLSLALVALLAPLLGALADQIPLKKRLLALFMGLGATATALMAAIGPGDWLLAVVLFALANVGANGSFVFYDALLPHVAGREEIDRVSAGGYALGYIGGGILLSAVLIPILFPATFALPIADDPDPGRASLPVRISFVAVAVWWAAFSIPLLRQVPEPAIRPQEARGRSRWSPLTPFSRLATTLRELRRYPHAFLMLLAFLAYNDGIGTIIRMAAIYGAEIGIGRGALIGAILMVQFIGFPCAVLFGRLAARVGAKRSIMAGLLVYSLISVVACFMTSATHFFVLAALVGLVQGGTQALSRSLFGSMIPRHSTGEFFGLFAVSEKFAGIFGPALFGLITALTGSSRNAIVSVIAFFAIGAVLLGMVDVEEGRRAAQDQREEKS